MTKRRRIAEGPVRIYTFTEPGPVSGVALYDKVLHIQRVSGRCETFNLQSYDLRQGKRFPIPPLVKDGANNLFGNRNGHVVCDNVLLSTTDILTEYEASMAILGNGLLLVTAEGIDLLTHVAVPRY